MLVRWLRTKNSSLRGLSIRIYLCKSVECLQEEAWIQVSKEMYLDADRQKRTIKGNVQCRGVCVIMYVYIYVCMHKYIYSHIHVDVQICSLLSKCKV